MILVKKRFLYILAILIVVVAACSEEQVAPPASGNEDAQIVRGVKGCQSQLRKKLSKNHAEEQPGEEGIEPLYALNAVGRLNRLVMPILKQYC